MLKPVLLYFNLFLLLTMFACGKTDGLAPTLGSTVPTSGGTNVNATCTAGTGGSGNQCADITLYPRYSMVAGPDAIPTATCLAATPNKPIETLIPTFFYAGTPTYSISPALPAGISINSSTGEISGTPTVSTGNDTLHVITVNTDMGGVYQCDFKYKVFAADTSGTSTAVGALGATRVGPQSAVLQNGNVLIVGGTSLQSAEIFNSTTKTFSATGQMNRFGASTATTLPNGTVIIGGGRVAAGGASAAHLALEIYNPTLGTFSAAGVSLTNAPTDAILLANGNVLFLEGASVCDVNAGTYSSYTAEIYNPTTNIVSSAGFAGGKTGTLLPNGKVLIRGYQYCSMNAVTGAFATLSTANARLYDPSNSSNVATGSSYTFPSTIQGPLPRKGLIKADGNIFFSDYQSGSGAIFQTYNVATGVFTSSSKSSYFDQGFPVREQADGSILLASPGRSVFNTYIPSTDTYNFGTAVMIYDHGATGSVTTLANGNILIVGKSAYGEYYKP